MFHHVWCVAEPVVWSSKTIVIAIAKKEVNRFGVAIRREDVSVAIDGDTKRIYLPVGKVLDATSIQAEPKRVPGTHRNAVAVCARYR